MATIISNIGRYWTIRDKNTGLFMPELSRKKRGGYTHTEPMSVSDGGATPRLFTTEAGAKRALRWWAKGLVFVTHTQSYEGEVDEDWKINALPVGEAIGTPGTARKIEDMEVVLVELSAVVADI